MGYVPTWIARGAALPPGERGWERGAGCVPADDTSSGCSRMLAVTRTIFHAEVRCDAPRRCVAPAGAALGAQRWLRREIARRAWGMDWLS